MFRRDLRLLGALIAIVTSFSARTSNGAEIRCIQSYPSEIASALRTTLLEQFPSGRLPGALTCRTVLIKGLIENGDSAKFSRLVRSSHPFLNSVALWSSGGLVEEAMTIGRLIRVAMLQTQAPTYNRASQILLLGSEPICVGPTCHCASACFLIWIAGVERTGNVLGMHRPTIKSTKFANLPPNQASELYRRLISQVEQYLEKMETPRAMVELAVKTSSSDMHWIKTEVATDMEKPPSIAEWLAASCGALSSSERESILDSVGKLIDGKTLSHVERTMMNRYGEIGRCEAKKLSSARDRIPALPH